MGIPWLRNSLRIYILCAHCDRIYCTCESILRFDWKNTPSSLQQSICSGLLTILSESIANTNTNIWFKKYCQYQYQYFFHKVLAIPIPILSNQYKYTNIINIVLLHLLITKLSNWVNLCKCPLKYCRYSYYCSLLAEYSLLFKTQKFAQRKIASFQNARY